MSWFLISLPTVCIQLVVLYGIFYFIYYECGCGYRFNAHWKDVITVILTIMLLATSVYAEGNAIYEEFSITKSLVTCSTYANDGPITSNNNYINLSSFQALQASVILLSALACVHIEHRLDSLLGSNGNATPRVLYRTWSGWNLRDLSENPVFDLPIK